jgi:NAD(P)-dependent dehydrogenase (short-subunit alcohol dehydrogenase family)
MPETRVAIVTGGASGLGKAITKRLLSDGLKVVVFSRRPPKGLPRSPRGRLLQLKVDITSPRQVAEAVEAAVHRFGRVDVLINNAGASGPFKPVQDMTLGDWNETLATNLTGAFICCKFVVPSLIKSGKAGRIVNVSSMVGKKAVPLRTAYSASKIGLLGLTRALSKELGEHGITVNAVCPGPIDGDRIKNVMEQTALARGITSEAVREGMLATSFLHRFSSAQEVAGLISYLVSDEGGSISGQDIDIDAT